MTKKPRFLLNVVVPESPGVDKPLICSFEKKSIAVGRAVSWNRYSAYLKDKIIGALKASKTHPIEELKAEGCVFTVQIYSSRSTRNFCISSKLTSSVLFANMVDELVCYRELRLEFRQPHRGGQGWTAF